MTRGASLLCLLALIACQPVPPTDNPVVTVGAALDFLDRTCGAAAPDFTGAVARAVEIEGVTPLTPRADRFASPTRPLALSLGQSGRHCTISFASPDDPVQASGAMARFDDLAFSDGAFRATYGDGLGLAFVPGGLTADGTRTSTLTLTRL